MPGVPQRSAPTPRAVSAVPGEGVDVCLAAPAEDLVQEEHVQGRRVALSLGPGGVLARGLVIAPRWQVRV